MSMYQQHIQDGQYVPNVVLKIMGQYLAIRQPDAGLVIGDVFSTCLAAFSLNSTSIDRLNPATSVSQNSFKLLDRAGKISKMFQGNLHLFQGELVEAWLGRSGVGMNFSEYLKLADTTISKLSKTDGAYTFSTKESKDRLATSYFSVMTKLGASIVPATNEITLQTVPPQMPVNGMVKIGNEFISYTGITGNNLNNCVRGELTTTPGDHANGDDVYLTTVVSGNPIDCILQLLISSGGGGPYDVLGGGGGIDQSLIDVAQFEEVRDEFFSGQTFRCVMFNTENLKQYIENELLMPCGVRLRTNFNGKIGLGVLNHPVLNIDAPDISHNVMTRTPKYDVDENKIYNRVLIEYAYDNGNDKFMKVKEFTDADSIAQFGVKNALTYSFKNIFWAVSDTEMDSIVDTIGNNLLSFFAWPRPVIETNAFISTSQWSLAERPWVTSTMLPNDSGELNFADSLELVEKAINVQTGDVKLKLQFNQFTGLRVCFIAPSDSVVSVISQKQIEISAGRGGEYRRGFMMKLFNKLTNSYEPDEANEIVNIVGDEIVFKNAFVTTVTTNHRLKFADYDEASELQKRFCYVGCGTQFDDGSGLYKLYCN